ncbi:hypothetical protein [Deinococcus sp. Marseille-Q6407]|uniref:hypothetical protein n=1 Tax=Deinococcus sp. Marseille-Q6407 TaxID=2969223 RepID=UPI0021BFB2F4|nr:hypothetical protein [Deinococcus sp. Marseille-Q6407]
MEIFRYIITRACLQEGSLRLQRSLRPHFPSEGTVKLFDDGGHEYQAQIDSSDERLLGVGPFYRDHNLGVNDVVLITPLVPGCYKLEGIIKPHARREPERPRGEAQGQALATSEAAPEHASVRVVVNATAHVREVRTQPLGQAPASLWASMEHEMAERVQRANRYVVPPLSSESWTAIAPASAAVAEAVPARSGTGRVHRITVPAETGVTEPASAQPAPGQRRAAAPAQTESEPSRLKMSWPRPQGGTSTIAHQRSEPAANLTRTSREQTAVSQQPQLPRRETLRNETRPTDLGKPVVPSRQDPVQRTAAETAQEARRAAGGSAAAASQRLLRDLAAAPAEVCRPSRSGGDSGQPNESLSSSGPDSALPSGGPARADSEELLESLARRCGYQTDHPAADLIRLRAELGMQSYVVLVASGSGALAAAEWRAAHPHFPTYRLWLTPEAQATADAPVVTHEALRQLRAEMQVSTFSVLDLRPLWEAGRLGRAAVMALAGQWADRERRDAALPALLQALAQQPAHGLVTLEGLSSQLHDLDPSRLNQLLTLLTRPPFRLLSHLGEGTYLLQQEVPGFLRQLGRRFQALAAEVEETQTLRSPAPAAGARSALAERPAEEVVHA